MDTTIDNPGSVRSSASTQPNPAAVWEPLADLCDAAAHAATESGTVAITRGFDRHSRRRSKALRELLHERGVAAIEITPAVGSERLLAGAEVAAVVNLVGAGSWQPYRLAATLRVPMFTARAHGSEATDETKRDVIGVTVDDHRDVALSRVAVVPEDAGESSITITYDGTPLTVAGGEVAITLHEQLLHISLHGPEFAEQTFTAQEVSVETSGAHRLVRDELPLAEFEGALTFTAEPQGLVVRPV
jgi:hypothetical protein